MMGSESRTSGVDNWLFETGLVSRGCAYNSVHWRAVASCSFLFRTYWVATAATVSLNRGNGHSVRSRLRFRNGIPSGSSKMDPKSQCDYVLNEGERTGIWIG